MSASKKRVTLAYLEAKGLVDNGDGTFSKPSKITKEYKNANGETILKVHEYQPFEGFDAKRFSESKQKKTKVIPLVYFNHMDIQQVYAKCEAEGIIFIKGNVPSSKNSMVPMKGKMVYSKETMAYKKGTDIHWRIFAPRFKEMLIGKEKPYKIEMTFIRDSRRKADHHNLCQLPMDIMTRMGWLDDDNMDEALVIPGNPPYGIDPKLPGLLIRVL